MGVVFCGRFRIFFDKVTFETSDLLENVRAAMVAISNLKPEVIKGKYISQVGGCVCVVMIPWTDDDPMQANLNMFTYSAPSSSVPAAPCTKSTHYAYCI